jgi:hypothetical protein
VVFAVSFPIFMFFFGGGGMADHQWLPWEFIDPRLLFNLLFDREQESCCRFLVVFIL